jgi:uncharacterized protein involved in exopolysaccharide biosynthesis/Mrp family chromosome partitioning ATPase
MDDVPRLFDTGATRSVSDFSHYDLLRQFFKHKIVILSCTVIISTAVGLVLRSLPPTFTGHAKVMIKIEEQGSPSFFSGIASYRDPTSTEQPNRKMENEMELVETWPLAAEAVKQLGLTYDQIYHPAYVHLLRPLADLYDGVTSRWLGWPTDPEKYGFADTVAAFQKSLQAKPLESKTADTNSNIIDIILYGVDPQLTQQALKVLTDLFADYDNRLNKEGAIKAQAVVAQHVSQARKEVQLVQQGLEDFLAKSGMSVGAAPTATIDPSDAKSMLTTPGNNNTIEVLKSRLLQMQLDLIHIKATFRDRTTQIRSLEDSIALLTDRLDHERQRHARDERSLLDLRRELGLKHSVLLELEKRLSQVQLFLDMGASQISNRIILDPPLVPRSSEWKQRLYVQVASIFGGFFLGIALAGLRELADHRLQTERDIRRYLGVPVVANLPLLKQSILRKAIESCAVTQAVPAMRDINETFNKLSLQLFTMVREFKKPDTRAGTPFMVCVTSAQRNEGKTLVAEGLAYHAASVGQLRILLVDANFDAPQLACRYSGPGKCGLSDILEDGGTTCLELIPTRFDNLSIIGVGRFSRPALLYKERAFEYLTKCTTGFDIVLFDAGCVSPNGANIIASGANRVLFVVDSTRTRREMAQYALEKLRDKERNRLWGIVLNKRRRYIPALLSNGYEPR